MTAVSALSAVSDHQSEPPRGVERRHTRFAPNVMPKFCKERSFTARSHDTWRWTNFSAAAGRPKGRGLSSPMRSCRSSIAALPRPEERCSLRLSEYVRLIARADEVIA